MDSSIKLNGYYIETSQNEYNTSGKVNGNWKMNLPFYIDLNKKVEDPFNKNINTDDTNYRAIGERLGEKKFNSIVFSNFSMGKGVFYDKGYNKFESKSTGVLLTGGIVISLEGDNEKDEILKENSKLFFQDMGEIKMKLNKVNSLSIGEINGDLSGRGSDMFGLERSALETLQKDPIQFLDSYCKESNESYQLFKKFITEMHSIFNILSWQMVNEFMAKPAIILFIAKAYKEINDHRKTQNLSTLEYFLTIQADLKGIESRIITFWFNSCADIFKQDQFEKPSSIIFNIMPLNRAIFEKSLKIKQLLKTIVSCPYLDKAVYGTKGNSLELCKSLFHSDSIETIKSKSILTFHINRREPEYEFGKKNDISKVLDESFIKELSQELLKDGYRGIFLYHDRCEYSGYYDETTKLPLATIAFDDSFSNYYSEENSKKINNYLNN